MNQQRELCLAAGLMDGEEETVRKRLRKQIHLIQGTVFTKSEVLGGPPAAGFYFGRSMQQKPRLVKSQCIVAQEDKFRVTQFWQVPPPHNMNVAINMEQGSLGAWTRTELDGQDEFGNPHQSQI